MQSEGLDYDVAQEVELTSRGRILVIDNDAGALEARTSSLRRDGHEVRALASLPEGMSCLEPERFDLIVLKLGEGPTSEAGRFWSVGSRSTSGGTSCFWHAVSIGLVMWMWPAWERWAN